MYWQIFLLLHTITHHNIEDHVTTGFLAYSMANFAKYWHGFGLAEFNLKGLCQNIRDNKHMAVVLFLAGIGCAVDEVWDMIEHPAGVFDIDDALWIGMALSTYALFNRKQKPKSHPDILDSGMFNDQQPA
jgi:hypothetical protein